MNIDALERDLTAKRAEITALMTAQAEAAEKEKRERTDEERAAVDKLLVEGRSLKARIENAKRDASMTEEIERLTAGVTIKRGVEDGNGTGRIVAARRETRSLGQLVAASAIGKFFADGGHRSASSWRSPSVEFLAYRSLRAFGMMAATLDSDPASGGDLIVPDYRPGIVPLLDQRLTVADLIAPGTTDSNLISYMKETTFTNAADTVLEGAAKPESTLIFDATNDPVRKIAHWLPVTEEMLEDVPQLRSYIDARLELGLDITEEDQLLNGALDTAPDISGILNRPGLTADQARGADSNADCLLKEIIKIQTTAFIDPDGIVLNPANWQTIQLTKNAAGNYLGTGPWAAPQQPMLWGLPVAVTTAIVAATGLVGAFRTAAQIFRKGGVRVEASNSHSDFFVKNLVAIRAEKRLALAVYRPAGFGKCTGLN